MRIVRLLSSLAWLGVFLVVGVGTVLPAGGQTTAVNQWTWQGGAKATTCSPQTCNQIPVLGTLGVLAAGNDPGSGSFGATWTDNEGNFWLFGDGVLEEIVWEFNPVTKEWGWMAPSSYFDCGNTCGFGEYGTLGVPVVGNIPGNRLYAMTWSDNNGNQWLFGGEGDDYGGNLGHLNDLWKFTPSSGAWEWISGSNHLTCAGQCGVPGVYGTLGIPAPGNTPGGRAAGMTWVDSGGHLWLFGGQGNDDSTPLTEFNQSGGLNDLWEFDPATTEWTWMGGSDKVPPGNFEPGVYGTMGVPSAANIPSSRGGGATWVDGGGHFWLFGGDAVLVANTNSVLAGGYFGGTPNDLWEFDPSTKEWTWMVGTDIGGGALGNQSPPGVYGTLGVPAVGNIPGGRAPAAYWTDKAGNFWLFGGFGYDGAGNSGYLNDLWEFNPSTMLWTWMSGSSTITCMETQSGNECSPTGVYGTLGTPAAENVPGGRTSAQSWTDIEGNLWLQGGITYNWTIQGTGPGVSPGEPAGETETLDDLWEFHPSTAILPKAATPVFGVSGGTYATSQSVAISDATGGATIYYTTNGTTPTTASAVYSGPIPVMSTETIEAIATASGYSESAVATATYTIPQSFGLTMNPTSMTVTAGASGTSTITLQDEGGFNGNVSFACSGLPAGATCSFTQLTVPTPAGVSYTTLTVATSSSAAEVRRGSGALLPGAAMAVVLCCFGLRKRRRLLMLVLLAVGLGGVGLMGGCGGAGSGGGSGGGGSQPVTSTVTVTGTSGTLSSTATFALTVN